jgi:general secretion pathway protein K
VRIQLQSSARGIALIIVMLVITVLTVLAAGFAYSMKVETMLARNVSSESEMELLGRSGVAYAQWILARQMDCPNEPFDALNQTWAGGPGGNCSSNGPLADVSLENNQLGPGKFSLRIIDLERKVNINYATERQPDIIGRALHLMSVDAFDASAIVNDIEDWWDRDTRPRLNGVESDYYLTLPQAYTAKDGPIDDLAELLLIRGVTPDIYWGSGRAPSNQTPPLRTNPANRLGSYTSEDSFQFGLVDLFSTLGRMQVNINTASVGVLQLVLGIDRVQAEEIVKLRAGLDNIDGTEDDTPLRNVGELVNAGVPPQAAQRLQGTCSVRSFTFEVQVTVQIEKYQRRLIALLLRNSPGGVQILNMYWE